MGAAQAAVLAVVAEKHEVVGAKSVWATPAGTHMHAHLDLHHQTEKGILHSGLGEQFCDGRMEMSM